MTYSPKLGPLRQRVGVVTSIGLLLCLSPSCALLQRQQAKTAPTPASAANQPRGWALLYPELMNPEVHSDQAHAGGPADGTASAADGAAAYGMASNRTAPGMFDFSGMFTEGSVATGGLNWKRSASEAIEESRQKGLPLLTLITHYNSKPAQDLESSVLRTPAFRDLSQDKMVLLRVDFYLEETRRSAYYQSLKQRLKSKGYPTLVLTLPDGTEILRLSGYKKEYEESHLRQLKHAMEKELPQKIEKRREELKNQGYRVWKSKDQRDVFAKLIALDANKATFMGEWGHEFSTFTSRLSAEDQSWIEQRRPQAAASSASAAP